VKLCPGASRFDKFHRDLKITDEGVTATNNTNDYDDIEESFSIGVGCKQVSDVITYHSSKKLGSFTHKMALPVTNICYIFEDLQLSISPIFMSSFLVRFFFVQLFCAYNLGLEFFGERILAQKLFIKCW